MKNKILMMCGFLAPLVYVFTVIVGGFLNPQYSHISQPVSDLIATGAPNKALLDTLLGVYNLLTLAFGLGLFQYMQTADFPQGKKIGLTGAVILLLEGLFGFATLFFPEGAGGMGSEIDFIGMMHIILASLSSITTMLAMLLLGFWFRKIPSLKTYGLYSFISVGAVFLSGGAAAATIASGAAIGGLMERITIGGFLQWLFVIALMMYRSEVLPGRADA